ncbi:bacteriophage antitermination protein Q [Buttiauxella sp. WJP83]|uniref:bacteriophage antitermination protein Q n=1 Tax=Buttiauxella sp. WJP83 TaxID=2986951 RepID=UPI0022DE6F4B|nr:bacteriophage antitermination protein Q [Buttiauxella sp. WJP83]WBM69150.1 bacteriophage antitermination protein Q [Buttiauxella sp. WJP83]
MNQQQLQYIREELMVATADFSGATKGQLVAFADNAQFDTGRYKRKRRKVMDEVTGKIITLTVDPVPGQQSRAKGSSIALVQPVEFRTASWRRALATLNKHEHAWLSWCYAGDLSFAHQVAITEWAWVEFKEWLGTRKIAGKTLKRLQAFVWLAAQDSRSELKGGAGYQHADLAALVGISKSTWSETYSEHWRAMKALFIRLDSNALCATAKTRSQQKATNLRISLAKPN